MQMIFILPSVEILTVVIDSSVILETSDGSMVNASSGFVGVAVVVVPSAVRVVSGDIFGFVTGGTGAFVVFLSILSETVLPNHKLEFSMAFSKDSI
jgi:hypothetical protein